MAAWAEPTVQQEKGLQPPPLILGEGGEDAPLSDADAQLKEDTVFFTSAESHFGHLVPVGEDCIFLKTGNFSLHFKHIYS